MSGTEAERAKYEGGIVFALSEDIAATCRYYLDRPRERHAIAERGRALYEMNGKEADILRAPVERLLRERVKSPSPEFPIPNQNPTTGFTWRNVSTDHVNLS